ncbi:hypothetical protein DPEC_G00179280, partial [Dallia pectoralis]
MRAQKIAAIYYCLVIAATTILITGSATQNELRGIKANPRTTTAAPTKTKATVTTARGALTPTNATRTRA